MLGVSAASPGTLLASVEQQELKLALQHGIVALQLGGLTLVFLHYALDTGEHEQLNSCTSV